MLTYRACLIDPMKPRVYHNLMRAIAVLVITLSLVLLTARQEAFESFTVWLRANPQAIAADSISSTTISAEVVDGTGKHVPDGTQVEFTTSLGIIERTATTVAGVARARLESGSTTGAAIVSAVVASGQAVGRLNVAFLTPGTEISSESFISVESDKHLGYDVNRRLVDAAGGVRIRSRGLTIDAEEAQINVSSNILRAAGRLGGQDITISLGNKKVTASALYLDFTTMSGVLLTPAADGAKRMVFRGYDLFVQLDTDPSENFTLGFEPVTESSMFIKARSLLIRPGQEIKIKRASFYVDGEKVLSIPLHVVPLQSKFGGMDRVLTYGTDGLRLDLPLYYSLSANGTGALRIKHSEPTQWGYYTAGQSGWQADIEQDYNFGASTDGSFTLNRITSGEWGASWSHRVDLGNNSQVYSFLDFPSHKDIYSTVDYRRAFKDYTAAIYFRGNKIQDQDGQYSTSFNIQSRTKPLIGNAVSYALSTHVSYANQLAGSDRIGSGLGLQLYGKSMQFSHADSLSTSMTISQDWGGGSPGTSAYANAGYMRTLGMVGQMGLNYTYAWGSGANAFSSQRLSADLSLRPLTKWDSRIYVTRGLDDKSTSAFGDFNYTFMPDVAAGDREHLSKLHGNPEQQLFRQPVHPHEDHRRRQRATGLVHRRETLQAGIQPSGVLGLGVISHRS